MTTDITQPFVALQAASPLVHNITNYVAMNTAANVLLAAGASPAMVHAEEEAPQFAQIAGALTVNIGTLSTPWVNSMVATASAAHDNNVPWVFDPVAVGATQFRLDASKKLLALKPSIVRGNASEIMALAGAASETKGVDSGDSVDAARESAQALTKHASVVIVTGETDFVTDGTNQWQVTNGHPIMPKVTALGCSLTGLLGGFAATSPDNLGFASVSALCYYGLAGELAAENSAGTGSFYVSFLDALSTIDADTLRDGAKFEAL